MYLATTLSPKVLKQPNSINLTANVHKLSTIQTVLLLKPYDILIIWNIIVHTLDSIALNRRMQ